MTASCRLPPEALAVGVTINMHFVQCFMTRQPGVKTGCVWVGGWCEGRRGGPLTAGS